MKKGVPIQTLTRMTENRAQPGWLSHGMWGPPSLARIALNTPSVGSNSHSHPSVLSAAGMTQGIRNSPRQSRWRRAGRLLIWRARKNPSAVFRSTAVTVKSIDCRTTIQKVSRLNRKR